MVSACWLSVLLLVVGSGDFGAPAHGCGGCVGAAVSIVFFVGGGTNRCNPTNHREASVPEVVALIYVDGVVSTT